MSKARLILAGTVMSGLIAVPAVMIPASAASTGTAAPSSSTSGGGISGTSTGPLLSVCLTVTPKSVAVGINGQEIVIGPAGVPRSCIATPF